MPTTYKYLWGKAVADEELANLEEESEGKSTKRFVTYKGQRTRIYTSKEYAKYRLFLAKDSPISDEAVLMTYVKEGKGSTTKHYVKIEGHKRLVFTATQLSLNRLFLDGQEIKDKEVLATHKTEGTGRNTKHYIQIEGQKKQVFTANQLSANRLFLNGQEITDKDVLGTHRVEGKGSNIKHYVKIEGQEKQVFTASQLSASRLFLDGQEITDKAVLDTRRVEGKGGNTKHYVKIDGREKQVLTAAQLLVNRLFLDGQEITDKEVLATHKTEGTKRNTKHYVQIEGQKRQVFTANQLNYKKMRSKSHEVATDTEDNPVLEEFMVIDEDRMTEISVNDVDEHNDVESPMQQTPVIQSKKKLPFEDSSDNHQPKLKLARFHEPEISSQPLNKSANYSHYNATLPSINTPQQNNLTLSSLHEILANTIPDFPSFSDYRSRGASNIPLDRPKLPLADQVNVVNDKQQRQHMVFDKTYSANQVSRLDRVGFFTTSPRKQNSQTDSEEQQPFQQIRSVV